MENSISDLALNSIIAVFQIKNILMIIFGISAGILLGALPGIGASTALAIFLPLTYSLPVGSSVLLLCSIYTGAEYGGSISAIAIRAPGTGGAAATLNDGYPLTQQGLPGKALGASLYASVVGGLFSAVVLALFTPPLAALGLRFGPPEMFALAVFGVAVIASLASQAPLKGFLSAFLGFLFATAGIDQFVGFSRFTFNQSALFGGIPAIPAMIGLFALAEAFRMVESKVIAEKNFEINKVSLAMLTLKEFRGLLKPTFRGSVIGTIVGIIPGIGTSVASFFAYDDARRTSKKPEEFGKGSLEGVAAPEAANNAVVGGALIPMLALGIPGSASVAMLMGTLIMNDVVPGPFFFEKNPDLSFLIFTGNFVCNLVLLLVGYFSVKVCIRALDVPKEVLATFIMAVSFLGAYAHGNNHSDMVIMFCFGIVGWAFGKMEIPVVPCIIAMLLGEMVESNFLSSILISHGDYLVFFKRPITTVLLLLSVATFVYSVIKDRQLASRLRKNEIDA